MLKPLRYPPEYPVPGDGMSTRQVDHSTNGSHKVRCPRCNTWYSNIFSFCPYCGLDEAWTEDESTDSPLPAKPGHQEPLTGI